MLKNELKRLYNQRFTGLLTISLVVLYLLLNMLPLYSSEYRVYKENLNSNHNTISQYYEEQSHYLLSFEDEVEAKLNNIGQQLESPLFKDEKSQVRLQAEQNRLTTLSEINLSINNIYVSNLILNHNYTGIILFVAVLFFVYCIFYQDIESGMLPLFQSTKKALIKLYITKIAALIFAITTLILPMLVISQILIYITTGPSIPVQTFVGYLNYPYLVSVMGANLVSFIQVMLNTLVIASLLLLFIMVFRKYIFSLIVVGIVYILEYLAFSLISLNSSLRFLKTINLYSFLTRFNLSNELVSFGSYVIQLETLVKIVFSILIVLFLSISCFIYKKNSDQNYKINMISIKTKSRLPYVQELQQILIEKKGLLVIVILCSITVFRFINFKA